METWDREELYVEVWERPLIEVAEKYGISDVALGKICRKLKIPLPGRGYWAKKSAGHVMHRKALPKVSNIPVLRLPEKPPSKAAIPPPPEPADPEYLRIKEIEARSIPVKYVEHQHKLVALADRVLRKSKTDDKGMLFNQSGQSVLAIRVSKASLDRALLLLNTIIQFLESEGFPVSVKPGEHGTIVKAFGYVVPFSIVEKYRQKLRVVVAGQSSWSYPRYEYFPSGVFEFRVAADWWGGDRFVDRKKQGLEEVVPKLVGALLRNARERGTREEQQRIEAIQKRQREIEMYELRKLIDDEESKVKQFEGWLSNWLRAREMREFIAVIEKLWADQGLDLSPEAEKGKRIQWMKNLADRFDPTVPSPPSILDRKGELGRL